MNPVHLPPFWFLLAVLSQFGLAWFAPAGRAGPLVTVGGTALLIAGAVLVLAAARSFRKWQTPILPFKEPSHCIADGVFRLSRNPIYLGEVFMLAGLAVLHDTWYAALPIPVFVFIIQQLFILPEERTLEETFGPTFAAYRKRTRRWL